MDGQQQAKYFKEQEYGFIQLLKGIKASGMHLAEVERRVAWFQSFAKVLNDQGGYYLQDYVDGLIAYFEARQETGTFKGVFIDKDLE